MAETGRRMSNRARVGDAFDLLAQCLKPFVGRHMVGTVSPGRDWADAFAATARPRIPYHAGSTDDPAFLLRVIADRWHGVFDRYLPRSARNLVFTLRDKRNEWAHNRAVQLHDALYTLSGILTLVEAVDAAKAGPVRAMLDDLNRTAYERERSRMQDRAGALNVTGSPKAGLRPWREVVHPHGDVHSERFNAAEFAADLEMVRREKGPREYREPRLFFERTYITAGLRDLLTLAVKRVTGRSGQPVISCQTNFGGGKTHSLIALYHLMSGLDLGELPGDVAALVRSAGADRLPRVNRAVVVGNRFGAGEVHVKDDSTAVNTVWGEIAYQLGGAEAYALVADSDRNRTNPGDAIRSVLAACSPCLILIDEWVAYARDLYERSDLPGGSFDSQFSFAQTLSEAAKATPGALFVVSIPASEGAGADGDAASSLEVGGVAGREALKRLTNVTNRLAETWQPASGDESYEIVKRRLFRPLAPDARGACDATAEAFGRLYRSQRSEFPPECSEMAYADRIKAAYPIHPEVFDRLYQDWSTVERFQRTRGVLRLMAATIDSLWHSEDKSPLILPCSIPLGDPRVASELAGRLPEYWPPVIDSDIDGPNSVSAKIDRTSPHLGALHATRRVARSIFVGATPNAGSANQGLEVRRIRLASTFAGDGQGPISDALNRLAATAPHLYVDRDRYWFGRQQNITRTARDDAERLLAGDRHEVSAEIVRRLKREGGKHGFASVHTAPADSGDVADDSRARLVVLGPDAVHIAGSEHSPALAAARDILDSRGTAQRLYRNMLVFAAAGQRETESLEEAAAEYLAWEGIRRREEELNLDGHQKAHAKRHEERSEKAVKMRLTEAYKYLLAPHQEDPTAAHRDDPPASRPESPSASSPDSSGGTPSASRADSSSGAPRDSVGFHIARLDNEGTVRERASAKVHEEAALHTRFPAVILRRTWLDGALRSRWEGGHVAVSTLWEDFARYLYLPRLLDSSVLVETVAHGPAGFAWHTDGFGVAAGIDERTGRYLGLVGDGQHADTATMESLVVHPDRAAAQLEADKDAHQKREAAAASQQSAATTTHRRTDSSDRSSSGDAEQPPPDGLSGPGADSAATETGARPATVFRGSVELSPARPTPAFTQINQEVLTHLLSQSDTETEIRLEIEVRKTDGFPDHVIRTVTENAATLQFDEGSGFS